MTNASHTANLPVIAQEAAHVTEQLENLKKLCDPTSKEWRAIDRAQSWLGDITNPLTDAEEAAMEKYSGALEEWHEDTELFEFVETFTAQDKRDFLEIAAANEDAELDDI